MKKIWLCKNLEQYNYLMKRLEERGWRWADKEKPTEWDPTEEIDITKNFIYIIGISANKVIYFARDILRCPDNVPIVEVKIPKLKEKDTATDSNQVKQPSHYIGEKGLEVREIEENFLVRYQDGHLAHLAGALLEYLLRAPSKGKLEEDIQKVKYLANEMVEYVEKVKEAR